MESELIIKKCLEISLKWPGLNYEVNELTYEDYIINGGLVGKEELGVMEL